MTGGQLQRASGLVAATCTAVRDFQETLDKVERILLVTGEGLDKLAEFVREAEAKHG